MGLALYSTFIAKNIPGPFGKPNNYTLFADSQDKNTYYILPEYPNYLQTPNEKAGFSMLWYAGGGEDAGGIITFTAALQMPDVSDRKVRTALNDAIHGNVAVTDRATKIFLMAKAHAENNLAEAEELRRGIGLDEGQAKAFYDAYKPNEDFKQFLPSGDSLVLKPVPVTSGSVTIRGFENPDLFKSWQTEGADKASITAVFETTPSYLNDNAAVISFNLSKTGVNLFWNALGGPRFDSGNAPKDYKPANSVVAVQYTVGFDAMLPEATATVTLHKEKVASYVKKTTTDTWGHKKDDITRKYSEEINNSITIDVPSSSYLNSEEGKKSVRDSLQDWAKTQLESMLVDQLPDIKLDDLGKGSGVEAEKINEIQDQSRSYKLSQAINIQKRPQGQLPILSDLVANANEYFTVIDLNSTPFVNVDITVNPPSKAHLESRGVESLVVTKMTYAGQTLRRKDKPAEEVHTILFPSNAETKPVNLVGQFGKANLTNDTVDYNYQVTYKDGTEPYQVNGVKVTGNYFVSIPLTELGVIYATLNGTNLPWGILDRVRVDVAYKDLYSQTFELTEAKQTVPVLRPIGKAIDADLQYKVTMYLKGGGTPLYYPLDSATYASHRMNISHDIQIESGLGSGGVTAFQLSLNGADITRALLRVSYKLPLENEDSREFNTMIELNSEKKSATWSVPSPARGHGELTVAKAQTFDKDGSVHVPTIEAIDSTSTLVMVGLKTISGF